MSSFSSGGGCAEGAGCHTRYDLTPISLGGLHANNLKDLRSTPADNGYVGATLDDDAGVPELPHHVHVREHPGVGRQPGPYTGELEQQLTSGSIASPATTERPPGTQATARIDGSGGVAAPSRERGTPRHGFNGTGQAGSGAAGATPTRDTSGPCGQTGSNPYGDWNSWAISPPFGGMDSFCIMPRYLRRSQLRPHLARVGKRRAYGPDGQEPTDTHPTTVQAVGPDKDRWYQVPPERARPVVREHVGQQLQQDGRDEQLRPVRLVPRSARGRDVPLDPARPALLRPEHRPEGAQDAPVQLLDRLSHAAVLAMSQVGGVSGRTKMSSPIRLPAAMFIAVLLAVLACPAWAGPPAGKPGHYPGQDCTGCHKIRGKSTGKVPPISIPTTSAPATSAPTTSAPTTSAPTTSATPPPTPAAAAPTTAAPVKSTTGKGSTGSKTTVTPPAKRATQPR